MIRKISFKNFYSFMEETEINMIVNKKVPDTDAYVTSPTGDRVTKLMAFVGPNASGKTNLLKCIAFMDWFITVSFIENTPDDLIPFKPFLFHSTVRPSSFFIEFETNNRIYKYNVSMTQERVQSETLVSKAKGKKSKTLFSRLWDSKKGSYSFSSENFKLPVGFPRLMRQNASIISTGAQVNHPESTLILQYFSKLCTNIVETGKVAPTDHQRDMMEFYNKNPKIRAKAEDILSKFDLGLSRIKIEKYEGQEKKSIYRLFGAHKYIDNDQEFLLPFQYESAGTKNLLYILRLLLQVLNDGGVAIIDEMEHDLHPLMIPEIVNLFTSKNYNPKNAQLMFSTHTAQILNKLDKQQIILVQKDKSVSEAWSLADIKGVRADDNFYAKYMAGAYGGVPKL